jgi:hypothetical protein
MQTHHSEAHPFNQSSLAEQIIVRLDRISQAALDVLRSDGTSDTHAVRAAITDAAERLSNPSLHEQPLPIADAAYADRLTALLASAPPLTGYQRYVLTAAFTDKLDGWLREDQWIAMRTESRST